MMLFPGERKLVYLGENFATTPDRVLTPKQKEGRDQIDVREKLKKEEYWAASFISHSWPKRPIPKGQFIARPGQFVQMKRKEEMNTVFPQGMHSCWQERWIHTKLSSIMATFYSFPKVQGEGWHASSGELELLQIQLQIPCCFCKPGF